MTLVKWGRVFLRVTTLTAHTISLGSFHETVNPDFTRLEIVSAACTTFGSPYLLAAIGPKVIGPYGGLGVGETSLGS